jgi:hypothetical protein
MNANGAPRQAVKLSGAAESDTVNYPRAMESVGR